jgi:hypothetical protein
MWKVTDHDQTSSTYPGYYLKVFSKTTTLSSLGHTLYKRKFKPGIL